MTALRILFLTYQGDIAGSTNSIAYLSKGLAARGHQVFVGLRRESLLYRLLEGSQVHRIEMTFRSKVDLENMRQIRDAVREHAIEVINAQSSRDRYTSILARWFFRLPVKLVHTRRQEPKSVGGLLQNWFYVKGTDRIVVISEGLKQSFIKTRIPSAHLHVIHNGIPTERYEQWSPERVEALRQNLGLAVGDCVVGSISRRKKQDQLLAAVQTLNDPRIKILLAGVEPGYYDDYAKQIGLTNPVLYAGTVDGTEVLNYYRLLDVHVLASTTDGFGLVLLEAMAMHVPVVATDFGGIRDVVQHEVNGLLFPDGDVKTLARNIHKILEDSALRLTLVENGLHTAYDTFAMTHNLQRYEEFFWSLLNLPNQ